MRDPLEELATQLINRGRNRRWIQGIAGIPGSGKSTLAQAIVDRINSAEPAAATLVPMDGFHFTNARLVQMGQRPFKGAPQTFDAEGYVALLRALREAREAVLFPVYDRDLHEPVTRGVLHRHVRVVITEGNYLLLDREPWSALSSVLDACWFLDTPQAIARDRIIARHIRGGRTADDAARHYDRTDLPNTRLVLDCRRTPDRTIVLE